MYLKPILNDPGALQVLDAQDFGLPHRRQRLWIVGINDNAAESTLCFCDWELAPDVHECVSSHYTPEN